MSIEQMKELRGHDSFDLYNVARYTKNKQVKRHIVEMLHERKEYDYVLSIAVNAI